MENLIVLMYHSLGDQGKKDRYCVSENSFKQQMDYLFRNNFVSVVPEDLLTLGDFRNYRLIMITFDDGNASDCSVALPVMAGYGFRGVSFITTSFVGLPGFLSWDKVTELNNNGFSVQSHTHTHALLDTVDRETASKELALSKSLIQKHTGSQVVAFSLPGGRRFKGMEQLAKLEEYRYIFDSVPRPNAVDLEKNIFSRIPVMSATTPGEFERIACMEKGACKNALFRYYLKNACRKTLGSNVYHGAWKKYVQINSK